MKRSIFIAAMLGLVSCSGEPKTSPLCPHFEMVKGEVDDFTDVEKAMVCGKADNPGWNNIPDNQATFHLKSFLEARGYFNPKFESKNGKVFIDVGHRTKATSLKVEGAPKEIRPERLRGFKGNVLNPALLNGEKSQVRQLLESEGYACPTVEMQASSETGALIATVTPGPREPVMSIETDPVEGLDPLVLRRYDAFLLGEPYNADLLGLTTQRTLVDGVVQSTYFTAACTPEGTILRQHVVAGPSRTVALGLGANTERGPVVRASWKNARLGTYGSSLETIASGSFKEQSLNAKFSWYYQNHASRHYLRPELLLRHENINPHDNLTGKLQVAPAWSNDSQSLGWTFFTGPILNFEHTYRGVGPKRFAFLSLGVDLKITDHYYELYKSEPQEGFEVGLQANLAQRGAASAITAQSLQLTFSKLWNFKSYLPPLMVFGFRAGLKTTVTQEKVTNAALPTSYRYTLGGSNNIRGFSLDELPGDDQGALTTLYASVEARVNGLLPFKIQPFLFFDAGALGKGSATLSSPLFLSPGLGLRSHSPIGVIRVTGARGMISGNRGAFAGLSPHWQFYFSYGEEF